MTLIQAENIDNTIELVSNSAGLELIDDVVEAKVVVGTKSSLELVLHMTKGIQRELTGTKGRSRCSIGKLLLDSLDEVLIALLRFRISSSIQKARFSRLD